MKGAYQTQCCDKEDFPDAPFDANCRATGFGGDLTETCGIPEPLESMEFDASVPFRTMRTAYRLLLKREPSASEVAEAFENVDGVIVPKKSYNQIENEILKKGVIDHLLTVPGAPNLEDETYVVVGGSGGLGFSAAVSLAAYTNIKKVYAIGRSRAPFEAQKKVAMSDGECQRNVGPAYEACDPDTGCGEIPLDVPNRDSKNVKKIMERITCPAGIISFPNVGCIENITVVQLKRQECDPMYYGPLNVPAAAFDKIEFIPADVRKFSDVEAAIAMIEGNAPPIGVFFAQIGGSFFTDEASRTLRNELMTQTAQLSFLEYGPGINIPNATEFESNLALGPERLIELSPDRHTSAVEYNSVYDSMQLATTKRGTANVQDALYDRYGYMNVTAKTVMTDAGSTTSYGSKVNRQFPIALFGNYFSFKATALRQIFAHGASGGKASSAFGDGIRTPSWLGFFDAPTRSGLPLWFDVLKTSHLHEFNTSVPFMLASHNLISTTTTQIPGSNITGPSVWSTFTNKDYDDLFSAAVFAAEDFYEPDASTFLTPHAQSLMYLHSFLLSLTSDTQPVLVNQLQYVARDLQETTKNVLDPSVRDLFSTITQFDCQSRRDALSQLVVIDDSTYGINTFADWS